MGSLVDYSWCRRTIPISEERMNILDRKTGTLVIFDDDAQLTSEVSSADIAKVTNIINLREGESE